MPGRTSRSYAEEWWPPVPSGGAPGAEGGVRGAGDEAGAGAPGHGSLGIGGNLVSVGVPGEVGGGRQVCALILGIPVEYGGHLLPGEGSGWGQKAVSLTPLTMPFARAQ